MEQNAIYFVIFFAAVIISRVVGERALRELSTEEKGILLDSFSNYRLNTTYATVILVVIFLLLTHYVWQPSPALTLIFLVSILGVAATTSVLSYRKLRSLNLPASYNRSYLIRLAIQFAGIAALFFPLAWQSLKARG